MKKYLTLFIMIFVATLVSAQELVKPESVLYDAQNERWLVSDVGEHNQDDGRILEIDDTGKVLRVITEGLKDPKGMAIYEGKLYVTDVVQVVVIDLSSGKIENRINHKDATSLNDICFVGNQLYVSDNMENSISTWELGQNEWKHICKAIAPNGLLYIEEDNAIYTASFSPEGKIYRVDLTTNEVTTKGYTDFSYLDGITRDGLGRYYVSNWSQGSVNIFDEDFNYIETLIAELNGPADIYYAPEKKKMAIPVMESGEVIFIEFYDVPEKPINLSPGDGSSNLPDIFKFAWIKCERAFGYTVYISKDIFFKDDKVILGNMDTENDTTYVNEEPFNMESIYYWYVEAVGMGGITSSDTILFITKGYDDVRSENPFAVSVFPLPLKENLNVNFSEKISSEARITILDINGREVFKYSTYNSNNSLDISELPKGSYFLILEYNNRVERAKLVK